MLVVRRSIALAVFSAIAALFWYGPTLLEMGQTGHDAWAVVAHVGGPLLAAILCFIAARQSTGGDRAAWFHFGCGASLYVAGNLGYVYYGLAGITPPFPALPELAYFLMAGFFAVGLFHYGKVKEQISRVQLYNFILLYCSVNLANLFFMNEDIVASVLDPFPTIVAFLYPALWFSVAAFGLVSLLLYDPRGKLFPFALLLLAFFAEASADARYALDLMDGSYVLGGVTQLLWVMSAGLIAWAAFDQIWLARRDVRPVPVMKRVNHMGVVQAAIPAAAVAMVLFAGLLTGAFANEIYLGFAMALALVFAVFAGLREHWIILNQRRLRRAVELTSANLAKSQQRLTSVLESTSDSVIALDRDWRIEFFNGRALTTANGSPGLVLGGSFWNALPGGEDHWTAEYFHRAVDTGLAVEFEASIDGTNKWIGVNAYPSSDGLSLFFRDISESRRVREEIAYLAHHDPLTGLVNRILFRERLTAAVESGAQVATLLLDLDHFKEINDAFGHPAGDSLLIAIAERLRLCLRQNDTIARLGGDEFAVILVDHAGTVDVARLARRIVAAASAPHEIASGQSLRVGASLGIALSNGGQDDPDRIFKNADIALYAAKSEAPGEFRFFEPAMETAVQERQALRADLRAALDNCEFELAYQPLLDLRSERICGFEALLRWRHPTRGMISPETFIPIAEDTGMIVAIGDWVLETACIEAATWPEHISVAVNLSTRQFANGDLAHKVEASLRRTKFDRKRLELEITESVLLKDSSLNLLTLRRLRELGIRIALDDFGTGFSSLGYLQKFPFSKIKIDRSFVSGLPSNEESQAIVRAVIGLGQALGMRVTAEGVETRDQFDWVKMGCDEVQGYYLSKPVSTDAVPALIDRLTAEFPAPPALPLRRLAG